MISQGLGSLGSWLRPGAGDWRGRSYLQEVAKCAAKTIMIGTVWPLMTAAITVANNARPAVAAGLEQAAGDEVGGKSWKSWLRVVLGIGLNR